MILVTGGAGFIGSHTCVALARAGLDLLVLDNFSNSDRAAIRRLEGLLGQSIRVVEGDVRDEALLREVFAAHPIRGVIHFAGLKAVGESVTRPLDYYSNNVVATLALVRAAQDAGCRRLVFSSSATVYGDGQAMPIAEDAPCCATNPYGRTKLMVEEILADVERAEPSWRIARLRYFNPVGAHPSAVIGESPSGVPTNLMPYVTQVASGLRPQLSVFGGDYPTPDGTGVRDFIHVMDLAEGHVAALQFLERERCGIVANLGTGRGTSVLQLVRAFERASGRKVPYKIVGRRPGDVATCYADVRRAKALLGWTATRDLDAMCADAWRWQAGNAAQCRD